MKRTVILISTILLGTNAINALSFSNLVDKVKPTKKEHRVIEKNYDVVTQSALHIKNGKGAITINSWERPYVHVIATVKATPEIAQNVELRDKQTDDALALMPTHSDKAEVDIVMDIPITLGLHVIHDNGAITIHDAHQPVSIVSNSGPVTVEHSHELVQIQSKSGLVSLSNIYGKIDVACAYGNIDITNAHNSIKAEATRGNIILKSAEVPSTSSIQLTAQSGTITTYLPPHINAELQAATKKGSVTCEHFITLKSQTTQLDKNAWQRFKKEVNGILGTGEASVALQSHNGAIAIKTYRTV